MGGLSVCTGDLHVFPCLLLRLLVFTRVSLPSSFDFFVFLCFTPVTLLHTLFHSFSFSLPVHFHPGSGSHFHFCRRPCYNAHRWATLSADRRRGPHSVRSHTPSWLRIHRTSVIAWRLGCIRSHVYARRGNFLSASTFRRTVSCT